MKLNKLHVRNRRARAISHRNPIAGRDIRIRRIKINFAAPAGGQKRDWGRECLHPASRLVQNVNPEAPVFAGMAEFRAGDQIDGEMIFEN
jgi:hypothetical protein